MILFVLPFMFEQSSAQQNAFAGEHHAIVNYWLGNETPDVPNKCGLPAINYALRHRNELDASLQSALTQVLMRPTTQKSILVGNFRIHYDTTGEHEPAILDAQHNRIPGTANRYADSVGAIVNYALRFERDSLGFLPPPLDDGTGGGPEYDIYIQELGGSFYGNTTPEIPINNKPEGGTFTSFIIIDNDFNFVFPDSNKGLPALRVTLAHELHHAIQLGNYGYWSNDIYFYEMTSVWMEDAVYTGVNDYYQYLRSSQGHFRNPEVSFTSNAFIMYSRGIWCHYVAKRFGREVVRKFWEEARNARPLLAMDAALQQQPYSTSLRNAFIEWAIWNYFTGPQRYDSVAYYTEGRNYPEITKSGVGFTPPSRTISGTTFPFSSRYYDIMSQQQSLTLLLSNVNTSAAQAEPSRSQSYSLLLSQNKVDETFSATSAGIFVKADVGDPTNWYLKDLFGVAGAESAFPNPFIVDGRRSVYFPITSQNTVNGTVSVFSSSMDVVYSAEQTSTFLPQLGRQVFRWDGRNENNDVAGSGIYFYVIESPTQSLKGKIAVIRK